MSIGRVAVLAVTAIFVVGAFSAALGGLRGEGNAASATTGIDLRKDDAGDDELVADDDRDPEGDDRTVGDADATRGNDGTRGGDNTGDGDATVGSDGSAGGDNSYAPAAVPAPAPTPAGGGGGDLSADGGGSDG